MDPKRTQGPEPGPSDPSWSPIAIGRYVLHARIARGGMATIHIARLTGVEGFSRIVAAKRLHPQFIEDADFVTMFLDEARIASKVHHPNVVPVLDVVSTGTEIVLVQEYIHGVPLGVLLRTARKQMLAVPVPIAVTVLAGMLSGLHAAHEARDELGQPLQIVHRDVSPQNVMVAVDGTPRLLDFGVAKATLSAHVTREGTFKGKISYTAPEQLRGHATRASDIYSAAVVLWEALVGRPLHHGVPDTVVLSNVVSGNVPTMTQALVESRGSIPQERWEQIVSIEPIVSRAMSLEPEDRFATAAQFAAALRAAITPVPDEEVAQWAKDLGKDFLEQRERIIAGEEATWRSGGSGPESGSMETSSVPSNPQNSGVASIPARDGTPPPPPVDTGRHRRMLMVALAALLGAAVIAIFVLLLRGSRPATEPATAAASAPATPTPPVPSPPAPAVPSPAQPSASVALQPPPSKPVDNQPAPPATSVTGHVARQPRYYPQPNPSPAQQAPTSAATATPTGAPAVDCNPPFYYVGKKKVYKDGCL